MSDSTSPYTLRTPADIVGMVPYLLGFHPSDSLVAFFVGSDHRAQGVFRVDMTAPAEQIIDRLRKVVAHRSADTVFILGYGPQSARQTVEQVATALAHSVEAVYSLLVSDGRCFCLKPGCTCPGADGVAIDPAATAVAAQSTVDGLVALPSREALLAQVEPDPAAQAATSAAMSTLASAHQPDQALLRSLMTLAKEGTRLTDEQVARLAKALCLLPVRDLAWQSTSDLMWQRDLWLDVTRRVPEAYITAPASLAAWCAWLRGEDTLASAAARKALTVDPDYTMALLITTGIQSGVPACDLVGSWPSAVIGSATAETEGQ